MKQSYRASVIETVTGTILGYLVAVLANWFILPLFGFHATLYESFVFALVFTAISVIRGFFIRRIFETLRTTGVLP